MTIDRIKDVMGRLTGAATALGALDAALDRRVNGRHLDPALERSVDAVLATLGLEAAFEGVSVEQLRPLLGEIRVYARSLRLDGARWTSTDRGDLVAAGEVSAPIARAIATSIAPKLDGLAPRLASPDGAFLDVGAGVAALSIAMAKTFPELRVVGIDPWAPALAIGRDAIRVAHLEGRVELREIPGEALEDEAAFDLAWIATLFIPTSALAEVLRRVRRSLRPGGWLLLPFLGASTDPFAAAVTRLRCTTWGGGAPSIDEGERALRVAGFDDIRRLPAAPAASIGLVAAR